MLIINTTVYELHRSFLYYIVDTKFLQTNDEF